MLHLAKQWVARALALCVIGPSAAGISHRVLAVDGSHQTTMLTGASVGMGLVCLLAAAALVLLTGVVFGRGVDRREGILNMAFVLGWVAWTSGRLGEVYRYHHTGSVLVLQAAEGAALGVAVLAAGALLRGAGTRRGHGDEVSRFGPSELRAALGSAGGLAALGASVVAAMAVAILFGQTDLAGQSVGVGFGAGILAGVAGAMAAGSIKNEEGGHVPVPFAPIMLGVMLCAVLGPLIGLVRPGAGGLHALVIAGDLPGYLIVSPGAWVMGALLGVPVGHSWVEHSSAQAVGAGSAAGA